MSLAHRAVYPTQPDALARTLDDLLAAATPLPAEGDLVALVVPDSNRLSGAAAAADAYALLRGAEVATVVLVSPSHEGAFGRLSICQTDTYRTPLGQVAVNDGLRNELCDEDDDIFLDDTGHFHVEGADVQIPFLQRVLGDGPPGAAARGFDVVPVVMGEETPAFCRELGAAVGEVLYARRAVVVGSCDVLAAEPGALDRLRAAIETFNAGELLHLLGSEAVRVEGMGAVITTVLAAKTRGATVARVLTLTEAKDHAPGVLACAFWRA